MTVSSDPFTQELFPGPSIHPAFFRHGPAASLSPLEGKLGKTCELKGAHSILQSVPQIWMTSEKWGVCCEVLLPCHINIASEGVARVLWGRAICPITHAMPSSHEEKDEVCSHLTPLLQPTHFIS